VRLAHALALGVAVFHAALALAKASICMRDA
jgi:hypothetical protein